MSVYTWIMACSWLLFLAFWIVAATGVKRNTSRRWGFVIPRILLIIAALEVFDSAWFNGLGRDTDFFTNPTVALVGAALTIVGVLIAIWARWYLAENWGMPMAVKENPELVTNGPYAYIRHPIYTGILLAMLGSGLVQPGLFIIGIFSVGYFVYSAYKEQQRFLQEFPETYPDYVRRTKMFIPFIF